MIIWKYPLQITDRQVINIPRGAQLLDVQMQGQTPQLWALCDETAPVEPRVINIFGTGNPIDGLSYGKYIATFQMAGGALVWHVFAQGMP